MRVFVRIALESCLVAGAAIFLAAVQYTLQRALKSRRERLLSKSGSETYTRGPKEIFRRPFSVSRIDD